MFLCWIVIPLNYDQIAPPTKWVGISLISFHKNWQLQPIKQFSHKLREIAKLFSNYIKLGLEAHAIPKVAPKKLLDPPEVL